MNSASEASPHGVPEQTIPLMLPVPPRVFEARAARLHELAPGHALGPYLETMAMLADAQLSALRTAPDRVPQANDAALDTLRAVDCFESWHSELRLIVSEMQKANLPQASRAALDRLSTCAADELGSLARKILTGDLQAIDLAASPFVGAALQVHFTMLASLFPAADVRMSGPGCPVCGAPPVAATVLAGSKLRYLSCSLCASRWYVPRLTCTCCSSTESLSYFVLEGKTDGTKAEACARCRTYLKLFYQESVPGVEPDADDLATFALDLLMAEKGYGRNGVNLLLLSTSSF